MLLSYACLNVLGLDVSWWMWLWSLLAHQDYQDFLTAWIQERNVGVIIYWLVYAKHANIMIVTYR